jgi:hypothetical protein
MAVPSFSSRAFCDLRMEDCLKTEPTKPALMTLYTPWLSSVPLKAQISYQGPMEDAGVITHTSFIEKLNRGRQSAGVIKLYEPSPTPCLYVADAQNHMVGRVPLNRLLSHCFWLVTRLQQLLTCSASARIQAFRVAVPLRLLRTDCGVAMSMRSTRGCGSLGVASPAWEA